ncbi:hypothetical protein BDV98DRAFT_72926 [Pterulicium gracile]|uniref:Uncharacterized protein n=1 Tax=Pterulicium gracile TaxID=1884261 RepID=A0A5C3QLW7_9AGAR|nr:hypothetical protein BDV98DRAFT_72926 [Pterula gracilis]
MNHRQSQSSTGHQQHSSYVQPSPCPASYHGTMSQRSSTSTAANVYPSSYAFGLPPPKEQDHPGSRFSQPTTGRSHPTWPSGTTTYRSLLAPVQGYTVPAVTSSSGRQNTPHAQQTHDNASSDGSSASIHRGQLKALIRILRDISQDLHIDGFDEADAKGICQALRKLRECLAAVEETQQNVQLFAKLRVMVEKLNDGLAFLTNTTSPTQKHETGLRVCS